MRKGLFWLGFAGLVSCASPPPPRVQPSSAPTVRGEPSAPPPLADWRGGLPPLDRVNVSDFKPALEWAMAHKRAEVERIANRTEAPDFENTIVALEIAGQPLADVRALFDVWSRSFQDEAFGAIEAELGPKLADFDAEILQNVALGRRVEAVYRAREASGLGSEQRALIDRTHRAFVLAGSLLPEAPRERLRQIEARLSELYVRFNQNLSASSAETAVVLRNEAELAGLPASFRETAVSEAAARGQKGAWLVGNRYVSVQAFLAHAERRDLREKVWRAFRERANGGGAHDNNEVVRELLALRGERAALLGAESYAKLKLEDSMLRTPERALEWLAAFGKPAAEQARREVGELQKEADRLQAKRKERPFVLQPWDLRYYEEQVRQAKYQVDEAEVSAYLDPELLREGMFWAASRLFNLRFSPLAGAPVPNPDVRAWAITRPDGGRVGVLYVDAFARPGKQSGAWAVTYREQQRLLGGRTPVVAVNYNLARPAPGARGSLTWFDAVGLFHEFGHALQALLSDVTYPSLAGLNVAGDTVEMASQWFERYVATPEVLERFTRHEQTGRPMPAALAARIERSRVFAEGIRTTAMLESAVLDLRLHLARAVPADLDGLERKVQTDVGAPSQVPAIGRLTQAIYLFGGDNYSAQFYSYLWSDELAAEVFETYLEGQGPYDRAVAARLRAEIFAKGASADPAGAFSAFRGRAPGVDALLKKRGLLPAKSAPSAS